MRLIKKDTSQPASLLERLTIRQKIVAGGSVGTNHQNRSWISGAGIPFTAADTRALESSNHIVRKSAKGRNQDIHAF